MRERAVRVVPDNQDQHRAFDCLKDPLCATTLNDGVKKAEVDSGKRAGITAEAEANFHAALEAQAMAA